MTNWPTTYHLYFSTKSSHTKNITLMLLCSIKYTRQDSLIWVQCQESLSLIFKNFISMNLNWWMYIIRFIVESLEMPPLLMMRTLDFNNSILRGLIDIGVWWIWEILATWTVSCKLCLWLKSLDRPFSIWETSKAFLPLSLSFMH